MAQTGLSKQELLHMLSKPQPDSTLTDIYNELCWPVYSYDQPDSSIYYGRLAIALSEKNEDRMRLSVAHRRIGITYINKGDIKSVLLHEEESYRLAEELGFKRGMQLALNNIGVAYLNNEVFSKALAFFLKSLKIVEETGDYRSAANIYLNCGIIYREMEEPLLSKTYFLKALQYAGKENDPDVMVSTLSHVSAAYRLLGKMDSTRYYLNRAAGYVSSTTGTEVKWRFRINEALYYDHAGDHERSLFTFLTMRPLATNPNDEITLRINIAEEYSHLGNTAKALEYFKQAYTLSRNSRMHYNLKYLTYAIAKIYRQSGDLARYADMMDLHLAYRDSNDKVNARQQIRQQQLEFDYERKQLADSLRYENREKLMDMELNAAEANLKRARLIRLMLGGLLILILLFMAFVLNRFFIIRRQKKTIEEQKRLVEIKNREILDSINYAKRLQEAILPQTDNIRKTLEVSILFLPKDIIGGDFYFFEKRNGKIFFAVCDCTGHGVPGAMMSVVCHHALEKSIREFGLTDPAEILNKTREIVIESLNAGSQNIRDGMDCSLLVIDEGTGKKSWAGANNSLWIGFNNELKVIKANKQPIGVYEHATPFTTHHLETEPGSILYLHTDGYADQFGGAAGKKYKTSSLKAFIQTVGSLPVQKQTGLLNSDFAKWKGTHHQVDDVTIAIIKL